jgi:hypothetical protein
VTAKSYLDLDPNPSWFASAPEIRILIRIEVKSWIRIRIKTNMYPQHWSGQQNATSIFFKHLTSKLRDCAMRQSYSSWLLMVNGTFFWLPLYKKA